MYIYISITGKAENSLKALDLSDENRYDCMLKTPSSIERPEVILSSFIPGAKYAWIPAFNRYYFIEDITAIHNERFSYQLSIDVLGTYSAAIKAKSLYCSRSSAGSAMLPDPLLTHKNAIHVVENNTSLTGFDQTGGYVLATVGGGTSSQAGSVSLYLITANVLNSMMAELFNASSAVYGSDITDDSVKTYFNPFQYIVSCHWVPFTPGTGSDYIKFGFWTSTYQGILLGAGYEMGYNFTGGITIPKVNGDDFTSFSPQWVRHDLYVPGFGNFPIDPKYSGKTIYINAWMDWATGQANCDICTGSLTSDYIGRMSGQLGIPIQLSQLSVDVSNIGSTLIGKLESATSGGAGVMARLIGIASNFAKNVPIVGDQIAGWREAMSPTLESCGTNGNRFYLKNMYQAVLTSTYFSPDNAAAVRGKFNYPDDAVRTLSGLSGYAVFQTEQSVNVGNSTENSLINAFLEGGVYIE